MLQIHKRLLAWYDSRTREMPWRDHPDPYAVWVSEIMLQQTQVETVKGYFIRFMKSFPTVQALADAPQQAVLKAWEGLGYYTRARNLQKAAQKVIGKRGELPSTSTQWAMLPGIGPYTAAAISSISFGEYVPVVDGNVARVFSRFLEWRDDFQKLPAREKLANWLQPFIEKSKRPGDFNQSMMDLGATVCTPRNPKCAICPIQKGCIAHAKNLQDELPVKPPKKKLPVRRVVAVVVRDGAGRVLFSQRVDERLLGGLWELPSLEWNEDSTQKQALRTLLKNIPVSVSQAKYVGDIEHTFSHFKLIMQLYRVEKYVESLLSDTQETLRFEKPSALPLTTATRRALEL
ncbi:MAG: A/G-specific adenine glycosylase [bacterium]